MEFVNRISFRSRNSLREFSFVSRTVARELRDSVENFLVKRLKFRKSYFFSLSENNKALATTFFN